MISSFEKINLSGNKLAEVFLNKTLDGRYIVAIPMINWSASFNELDEFTHQFDHLQTSLNHHLYEGDTDKLAEAIINMVKQL
ncbi:hypothetical protein JOC78_001531 [Bacillus ectoiniformans]|uniref:YueH family protein n=1 Tax=Bacillus ectoiniformans TaxID=1494429 RepID=UPI00195C0DDA|nr:hypothetical protein [Bacillus ectoiniformans]